MKLKKRPILLLLFGLLHIQASMGFIDRPFEPQTFSNKNAETKQTRIYLAPLSLPSSLGNPSTQNSSTQDSPSLGDWLKNPGQLSDINAWTENIQNQFGLGIELQL